MRLAVIGDTRHYRDDQGRLCAIAPVAAQLDRWAALFDEVVLCTSLLDGHPPPHFAAYRSDNVTIEPLPLGGGRTLGAKLRLLPKVWRWWRAVRRIAQEVDAVHLRCPCNVTLVAIPALARWKGHKYAIYAGNWEGFPTEPWSSRAQRWMLRRPGFGGPVSIYTATDPPVPHLVPFFTTSFSRREWEAEAPAVGERLARLERADALDRVRLATVGAFKTNKNQRVVIEAVSRLRRRGLDVSLDCAGDGELMTELTRLRSRLGLDDAVVLHGTCDRATVMALYRDSDLNVVPSRTEGYSKVVIEGMVAGAVPLMSRYPMAYELAGNGERGLTFAYDDPEELARLVAGLAADPPRLAGMVRAGRAYSHARTLDAFEEEVRRLLERHWGVPFSRSSVPT